MFATVNQRCVKSRGVIYQTASCQCSGELYTGLLSFLLGEILLSLTVAYKLNLDYNCCMLYKQLCFGIFTVPDCFSGYTGCCCPSCSLMHGQELSPKLERLKQHSLKMQSTTAPTSLYLSLCSSMWLLTHSGN